MKNEWRVLVGVCALVVGIYAYATPLGTSESRSELLISNPADTCYNLLVQGLRDGHLSLKIEVPTGLTQLTNPYDPTANAPYRAPTYGLNDLSYYKGRLYLYFGVTPALLLFWPYNVLTGHYLSDGQAVLIFCALGFLSSVAILYALRRRYFPDVSTGVVAAGALALGLATGVPTLLPRSNVNEVAISCAYMLTMVSLGAIWRALNEPEQERRWLAVASVAYGLAVGARPSLVFGSIILLAPVVKAWRDRRPAWPLLLSAAAPITMTGLGLMLYDAGRFDSPFEFGLKYQLTFEPQPLRHFFDTRYLWFNLRVYFLEPLRWGAHFPFVHESSVPPLPSGYAWVETPFGILTSVPLVWRDRPEQAASILRWFGMVVALLFGICVLTVGFYNCAIGRYEVDFLPALVLLAVVGIFGSERALASTSEPGLADRPRRRCVARWGGLLLGFSVAFNLLASVERCADTHNELGFAFAYQGQLQDAVREYHRALGLMPDYAKAYNNLGVAYGEVGNHEEAVRQFEQALRIRPAFAEAHYNLGNALPYLNKPAGALGEYKLALQCEHNYPDALHNLGATLVQLGRLEEAVGYFKEFLRANPNDASGRHDLGVALLQAGRNPEAITQFEQALRIRPDYAEAHCNLGIALALAGRTPEAIEHLREALRIQPDYMPAKNALARLGAGQ